MRKDCGPWGKGRVRRRTSRKPKKLDAETARKRLMDILHHPTRAEILKIFLEEQKALCPAELARKLGKDVPAVAYHVAVTADKGGLVLTEEERVRGSIAHFYELTDLVKNTPWALAILAEGRSP